MQNHIAAFQAHPHRNLYLAAAGGIVLLGLYAGYKCCFRKPKAKIDPNLTVKKTSLSHVRLYEEEVKSGSTQDNEPPTQSEKNEEKSESHCPACNICDKYLGKPFDPEAAAREAEEANKKKGWFGVFSKSNLSESKKKKEDECAENNPQGKGASSRPGSSEKLQHLKSTAQAEDQRSAAGSKAQSRQEAKEHEAELYYGKCGLCTRNYYGGVGVPSVPLILTARNVHAANLSTSTYSENTRAFRYPNLTRRSGHGYKVQPHYRKCSRY